MYLDGFKTFMDEVPRTQPAEPKEEFEWFTGFDGIEPDPITDPMRMPVNFTGELPTVLYSKEDMINNMHPNDPCRWEQIRQSMENPYYGQQNAEYLQQMAQIRAQRYFRPSMIPVPPRVMEQRVQQQTQYINNRGPVMYPQFEDPSMRAARWAQKFKNKVENKINSPEELAKRYYYKQHEKDRYDKATGINIDEAMREDNFEHLKQLNIDAYNERKNNANAKNDNAEAFKAVSMNKDDLKANGFKVTRDKAKTPSIPVKYLTPIGSTLEIHEDGTTYEWDPDGGQSVMSTPPALEYLAKCKMIDNLNMQMDAHAQAAALKGYHMNESYNQNPMPTPMNPDPLDRTYQQYYANGPVMHVDPTSIVVGSPTVSFTTQNGGQFTTNMPSVIYNPNGTVSAAPPWVRQFQGNYYGYQPSPWIEEYRELTDEEILSENYPVLILNDHDRELAKIIDARKAKRAAIRAAKPQSIEEANLYCRRMKIDPDTGYEIYESLTIYPPEGKSHTCTQEELDALNTALIEKERKNLKELREDSMKMAAGIDDSAVLAEEINRYSTEYALLVRWARTNLTEEVYREFAKLILQQLILLRENDPAADLKSGIMITGTTIVRTPCRESSELDVAVMVAGEVEHLGRMKEAAKEDNSLDEDEKARVVKRLDKAIKEISAIYDEYKDKDDPKDKSDERMKYNKLFRNMVDVSTIPHRLLAYKQVFEALNSSLTPIKQMMLASYMSYAKHAMRINGEFDLNNFVNWWNKPLLDQINSGARSTFKSRMNPYGRKPAFDYFMENSHKFVSAEKYISDVRAQLKRNFDQIDQGALMSAKTFDEYNDALARIMPVVRMSYDPFINPDGAKRFKKKDTRDMHNYDRSKYEYLGMLSDYYHAIGAIDVPHDIKDKTWFDTIYNQKERGLI